MGRENARRVVCVSNIKTQLAGFINLANENNGKIFGDYGWLDGTDRYKYRDLMESMGLSTDGSIVDNWNFAPLAQQDIHAPDIFYCPSNISKTERNRQLWWDFDTGNRARAPFRNYRLCLDTRK